MVLDLGEVEQLVEEPGRDRRTRPPAPIVALTPMTRRGTTLQPGRSIARPSIRNVTLVKKWGISRPCVGRRRRRTNPLTSLKTRKKRSLKGRQTQNVKPLRNSRNSLRK